MLHYRAVEVSSQSQICWCGGINMVPFQIAQDTNSAMNLELSQGY